MPAAPKASRPRWAKACQKAANAAGIVEQQIATIADLGAKIKELLQVEQALERAMAGIAGADEIPENLHSSCASIWRPPTNSAAA